MTDDLAALRSLPPATCYREHTQPDEHRGVFGAVWLADVKRARAALSRPAPASSLDAERLLSALGRVGFGGFSRDNVKAIAAEYARLSAEEPQPTEKGQDQ